MNSNATLLVRCANNRPMLKVTCGMSCETANSMSSFAVSPPLVHTSLTSSVFSHQLIVELDGPQHVEAQGKLHDERRTAWLDEDACLVVEVIQRVLREQSETPGSPPSPALPNTVRHEICA